MDPQKVGSKSAFASHPNLQLWGLSSIRMYTFMELLGTEYMCFLRLVFTVQTKRVGESWALSCLSSSQTITIHHAFLEHWNSQKSFCNIQKRFLCLLDVWIELICVLGCTWTGRSNLKKILGCNINYLSIWPFMSPPWFSTRMASKLTFVCFQLQLFSPALCSVIGAESREMLVLRLF